MTQPLNYTVKAIEAMSTYPCVGAPGAAAGFGYLLGKLREAEVFVLPDHGELLDREKPRPEVPGVAFTPAFPVVALEYTADAPRRADPYYTAARSSKRIALAWRWTEDRPEILKRCGPPVLSDGVVVASIYWSDQDRAWVPVAAAMHLSYDDATTQPAIENDFVRSIKAAGAIRQDARGVTGTLVPILPEVLAATAATIGPRQMANDISGDLHDEMNAFIDLCCALACANVGTERIEQPPALQRSRLRAGKLPLRDFHVLRISGERAMPGQRGAAGDREAARSHLRRGHIRRLPGERVTWVNATIVRGRGFVDKVYAA